MRMFHFDDRRLMEEKRKAQKAGKVLARDALDWERSDMIRRWEARQEQRLIIAAQHGNKDAFIELFEPYRNELWKSCYYLTNRQREDAEDLSQETLLKALEKINTFQPDKKFRPWLFRIAIHTHIDWIRRQNRAVKKLGWKVPLQGAIGGNQDDEGIALIEQLPDETMDTAEAFALRETFKESWSKLDLEEQMTLIFIFRWEGTFKELGWMKGAKPIEPGDDDETTTRKRQSAHNTGKYHVSKVLQKLEGALRAGGLDLASSQVRGLIETQETEGGVVQ